jgi:hypothetical protein
MIRLSDSIPSPHFVQAPGHSGTTVDGVIGGAVWLYPDERAIFCKTFSGSWVLVDRSSWKPGRLTATQLLRWLEDRLDDETIVQVLSKIEAFSGGESVYSVAVGSERGLVEGTDNHSLEGALRDLYHKSTDHNPGPKE